MSFLYIVQIVLMVTCIVHMIRGGRNTVWAMVIIFLPLIGSLIYIAMEMVPDLLGSRGARQMSRGLQRVADPHRDLRAARREVELSGSVDARKNLAEQYVLRGQYGDAISLYEGSLVGQFANDPALLQGYARALFLNGDGAGAQAALDRLQAADPNFVSADAHLLYACALELQGKDSEALDEYARLVPYYPGEEARCRYGLLLAKAGDRARAKEMFQEVVRSVDGAPRHYRQAQREWAAIARKNI